jgi:AcrR family transcriptional regulator
MAQAENLACRRRSLRMLGSESIRQLAETVILAPDMPPESRSEHESRSFSPLPTGRHGLDRRVVADHQRTRLVRAMIQMVAAQGFPGVTIAALCKRARVTERAFYAQFDTLEECFLAAYDSILERYIGYILAAYDMPLPWDEVLRDALRAVLETTAEHPEEAHLVLVDAPTAGRRGIERNRRLADTLQAQFARHAERAPGANRVSGLILRGLVGGIRDVVGNRVAANTAAQLPGLLDPLVAWLLSYVSDARLELARGRAPRRRVRRRTAAPPPLAGHGYPREYVLENQRRRLTDAVAAIVHEKGYAGLTVSGIARRARVSHQTFYEHFSDRHQAFLSTYEDGCDEVFKVSARAYLAHEHDWPRAVHAGLDKLLEWLAERPEEAYLAFVACLAIGADVRRIRYDALQKFAAALAPGYERASDVPAVAGEAIAGGIFEIIAEDILRGRAQRLQALLPLVTYITLAPFIGPQEAVRIANERPFAVGVETTGETI